MVSEKQVGTLCLGLLAVEIPPATRYNAGFPRKLHGRILPAHFFCLIDFESINYPEKNPHFVNWLDAVERTVTALGYDLVDTERTAGGLLRVSIDRIPGKAYDTGIGEFITVDDCEKVTRQLQHVLEVEVAPYERLEVSSPGLDRPLKREADYQRFVGEQVALTLKLPFQGRKKYQGVLEHGEQEGQWRVVLGGEKKPVGGSKRVKARLKPLSQPQPAVDGVATAATAALAASPTRQALTFTLAEVREARLVPVLDFKGRRFAEAAEQQQAAPSTSPANELVTGDQVDGGRDK